MANAKIPIDHFYEFEALASVKARSAALVKASPLLSEDGRYYLTVKREKWDVLYLNENLELSNIFEELNGRPLHLDLKHGFLLCKGTGTSFECHSLESRQAKTFHIGFKAREAFSLLPVMDATLIIGSGSRDSMIFSNQHQTP